MFACVFLSANQIMMSCKSIFFLLLFLSSCASKSFLVSCVDLEQTGYIHLSLSDHRQLNEKRYPEARKQAIHTVLYTGVAQSAGCPSLRPLLQSSEERDKFQSISNEVFSKDGRWSEFTNAIPQNQNKDKTSSYEVYSVAVALDQLRLYLEDKKILKPLNSIF